MSNPHFRASSPALLESESSTFKNNCVKTDKYLTQTYIVSGKNVQQKKSRPPL